MLELLNKDLDIKNLKETIQVSEPYPHFCIDNFLNEEFANQIYNSFPSFQEAQKTGKEFNTVNEQKKIQITDASKFPPAITRLNQLLASAEFIEMISDLMGIANLMADTDLTGGGIHETHSGGRLDVHVDFNYNENKKAYRRLNILIFFNKDWKEEYGGYLDIWDKDVKKCYGSFAPIFNRACGFATSGISYHGVTPLTCPPESIRKSFASYFYTKEAPEGWSAEKHSTIFKARPDEWMRRTILMPTESAARQAKRMLQQAKDKMKKILGR